MNGLGEVCLIRLSALTIRASWSRMDALLVVVRDGPGIAECLARYQTHIDEV